MERSFAVNTVWDEHKLAIEIQGGIRHDVLRSKYDAERLLYLESQGIGVLSFENRELLEIPDCVVGHSICGAWTTTPSAAKIRMLVRLFR